MTGGYDESSASLEQYSVKLTSRLVGRHVAIRLHRSTRTHVRPGYPNQRGAALTLPATPSLCPPRPTKMRRESPACVRAHRCATVPAVGSCPGYALLPDSCDG